MKPFNPFLLVLLLLTACASQGGGSTGTPQGDTTRAQKIARVHTELAGMYYDRTQYGVALQEVAVALKADSGFSQAYNVRALVRMALHEDDKADEDFQHSLRLDNTSSETHNNYGWFLCQGGRMKEAFKQFQDALNNPLYATPETAYTNLGLCSRKAGLMKEAESNLQRALVLRPDMPNALYGLADLNYANGDFVAAKSYLNRFVQVTPELNAEQLWLAVRIERKARDRDSEASYALQLRKNFPDSREVQLLLQGQ